MSSASTLVVMDSTPSAFLSHELDRLPAALADQALMPNSSPLHYTPLRPDRNEFRIFTLFPADGKQHAAEGSISVESLDCPPQYEAISWYWGDASITETITVNGVSFEVPRNMFEALIHMRLPDRARRLWTDAICINQADLGERAAQIRMMGDIYRLSRCTLVWLGPLMSRRDQDAMDLLRALAAGDSFREIVLRAAEQEFFASLIRKYIGQPTDEIWLSDSKSPSIGEWEVMRIVEPYMTHVLVDFFELPWWGRLWVLQEISLGSHARLYLGNASISFTEVSQAIDRLSSELQRDHTGIQEPVRARDKFLDSLETATRRSLKTARHINKLYIAARLPIGGTTAKVAGCRLVQALEASRGRLASDKRDMIYGLLGLFPRAVSQLIPVSYSVGWDVVFVDTAALLLELAHSFMLFNCLHQVTSSLPSWTPLWGSGSLIQDLGLRTYQEEEFNACDLIPWFMSRTSNTILHTRGCRVDEARLRYNPKFRHHDCFYVEELVDWCTKTLQGFDHATLSYNKAALDTTVTCYDQGSRYVTGNSAREAVLRTLLKDSAPSAEVDGFARLQPTDMDRLDDWLCHHETALHFYASSPVEAARSLLFEGVDSPTICDYLCEVTRDHEFWVSRLGYAALTIKGLCEPGDEIWLLAGGSHPVILRPIAGAGKPRCFQVVTEAYVHGIMDGEAARGECPVLPLDGRVEGVVEDINNGRKTWPRPVFQDIELH